MIRLNVHEAKTHLSRYLARLEGGEVIVLCRRNVPIAEIRAIPKQKSPRPYGLAAGEFEIPEEFHAPLPADLIEAFDAGGSDPADSTVGDATSGDPAAGADPLAE